MNVIATDCETYMRLMVDGRVDTNTSPQLQQAILNAFQKHLLNSMSYRIRTV